METPILAKAGVLPIAGAARGGDYSATEFDPAAPSNFWSANQYQFDSSGSNFHWGTQIVEFSLGAPGGPFVISQTPSGTVFPPVTSLQVTFSEPVLVTGPHGFDPTTNPGVIGNLTGPAFTIASVTPVSPVGGFATTFTITFGGAGLTAAGAYGFHIGPNIEDAAGHMMDQNENGIPGEPTDFYPAAITIASPAITSSTPTGTQTPGVTHVHVTFNEPVTVASFTTTKITAFTRNGVSILGDILNVTSTGGPTTSTGFDINFVSGTEVATGVYSMTIGPNITDPFGNPMASAFVGTFNIDGPKVTHITPSGGTLGPISSETVTFSRAMLASTFTTGQITITGPGGPVAIASITPSTGSATTFTITFAPQSTFGVYTTTIGPNITDTFGNKMDQNGNFIPGEPGVAPAGDQFRSTFTVLNPVIGPDGFGYTASLNPTVPFVELVGDPGAFVIMNQDIFDSVPVNLGSNKFNYYGRLYTGNNQLYVGSGGVISFGAPDFNIFLFSGSTDLTSLPPEPVFAPLWADWYKFDSQPMVLGKFDTVNNRLIIEWNQVHNFDVYYYSGYTNPGGTFTFEAILQLNTPGTHTANVSAVYKSFSDDLGGFFHTVGSKGLGTQPPDLSGYRILVEQDTPSGYVQPGFSLTWSAPDFGGTITGNVYNDLLHSGMQNPADPPLAGWTVYEDLNNNGQFDPGEPFAITDANGNYTIHNAFPFDQVVREVLQPGWVRSQPRAVTTNVTLDDFESGPSDLANYTFIGTDSASVTAAAAHDGSFGLRLSGFSDWMFRNDATTHVAQGDDISVWVRQSDGSGRAYFGFGATASGTLSVVMAPNTGQFIIQDNSGYGFTDIADANQTWAFNHWYRFDIQWGTDGTITARLYDSDGTTLLNTITAHATDITSGGIAFRGFNGNTDFDTVTATVTTLDDGYVVSLAPRGTVASGPFGNYFVVPNPIVDNRDFGFETIGAGWTTRPGGYNGDYASHADLNPELVVNGGFETGDFTGWTVNDPSGFSHVDLNPHSGTFSAWLAGLGVDGILTQTIPTIPGDLYRFSFWEATDGGTPNDFSAKFGGVTVFSVRNDTTHGYVLHTFTVMATSTSTVIQFAGRNDPAWNYLDDVSVVDLTNPPAFGAANWFVAPPGGPGSYELFATWVAAPGNATNIKYTVSDGISTLGTVTVNQQKAANQALIGGVYWLKLGTFTSATGIFIISIDNTTANGNISADAVFAAPVPTELVVNGGFETGDFTGWTVNDPTFETFVSGNPHSGSFAAWFGAVGQNGTISQTIATVPGNHYTFTFWLASDGGTPNDFSASFGGVTVFSVTNDPSHGYVAHTFNVVATGASAVIQFAGRDDPGFLQLDDVSVVDPPPMVVAPANGFVAAPVGSGEGDDLGGEGSGTTGDGFGSSGTGSLRQASLVLGGGQAGNGATKAMTAPAGSTGGSAAGTTLLDQAFSGGGQADDSGAFLTWNGAVLRTSTLGGIVGDPLTGQLVDSLLEELVPTV
jgi:hypothetical protein